MEEEVVLQIESADIPAWEDIELVPISLRQVKEPYWLQTIDKVTNKLMYVGSLGFIYNNGDPYDPGTGVRPILTVKGLEKYKLKPLKDELEIFGQDWIYIGGNKVLKKNILIYSQWSNDGSIEYYSSLVKKILDKWLDSKLSEED